MKLTVIAPEEVAFEEDDLDVAGSITIHKEEVEQPTIGSPYNAPVEIIVDARCWQLAHQHAREDLHRESGGVLVGNVYQYEKSIAVRLTMAIPAREAIRNVASITFTYETWRQMEEDRRQRAPTEKLIGWYHTHPGFGSTFSGFDYFLHESFFKESWHVALLIDPVNNTHRFYRWEAGNLVTCTEYLLQVCEQKKSASLAETPLDIILKQQANSLIEYRDRDTEGIEPLLRKLANRVSNESSLEGILSLIVASSELDAEMLESIRKALRKKPAVSSSIQFSDLTFLLKRQNNRSNCHIQEGWLLELRPKDLHVHDLHTSHTFCQVVPLAFDCRDVTSDERGNIFLLSHGNECIVYKISPSYLSWNEHMAHTGKLTLHTMTIDWGQVPPPQHVGKMLLGYSYLYLLTRTGIYVLHTTDRGNTHSFTYFAKFDASSCNCESFELLTDWNVDVAGNLYLLIGETKGVWLFNPLKGKKGLWQQIIEDEELQQPISFAIGPDSCYIYDYEAKNIAEYKLNTQHLISRRTLASEVQNLGIRQLFSDGKEGMYIVSQKGIYLLP